MSENTVYQFAVEKVNGEKVSLEEFKNKVLLIVNTASECGFTPQLEEMEALRKEFQNKDFEVLAFPSNDFGGQEPLEGEVISKFCAINFKTHFPIFSKIKVKGKNAHPLFKFLSNRKLNGHINSSPKWNFHKYLIDRNGEVVDYFYSFTKPTSGKIKTAIAQLL